MKLISKSHVKKIPFKCRLFCMLAVLSLILGVPLRAQPASAYRFQSLTDFYADVAGISNAQVVAGNIYDDPEFQGSDGAVGSILTRSYFRKKKNKGYSYEYFKAVNTSNVIVGYGESGGFPQVNRAFILRDGSYTYLLPRGSGGAATSSFASGINDRGVVVGTFTDSLGQHGFVLQDGVYTVLDVPGMTNTSAQGINNPGVITVFAKGKDGRINSFVYENGTYTMLNVPGAQNSYIHGINDFGMIVFNYGSVIGVANQSKVYYRGQFTEFIVPGSSATSAIGINNAGVISGNAGSYDVFVAIPIR